MILFIVESEIGNARLQHEVHAAFFEPFPERPHHRIVLVVDGSHDAGKRVEAGDHVSEAYQITFKLDSAMPGLKSECSAPHVPEVRLKEPRIELI